MIWLIVRWLSPCIEIRISASSIENRNRNELETLYSLNSSKYTIVNDWMNLSKLYTIWLCSALIWEMTNFKWLLSKKLPIIINLCYNSSYYSNNLQWNKCDKIRRNSKLVPNESFLNIIIITLMFGWTSEPLSRTYKRDYVCSYQGLATLMTWLYDWDIGLMRERWEPLNCWSESGLFRPLIRVLSLFQSRSEW